MTYFEQPRSEMLAYIPPGAKRVLDVGCGAGVFGAQLRQQKQAEVWGIEPVAQYADDARPRLDKVLCSKFEDCAELPRAYFDCIVFNDVLEHMVEPEAALARARPLLAKTGVVVASIPNMREYNTIRDLIIHQDWRYVDAGVLDRTHLRFFTKKSMTRLFQTTGYSIETIAGINPFGRSRFLTLLNLLSRGRFEDMYYVQFAVVARPVEGVDATGAKP